MAENLNRSSQNTSYLNRIAESSTKNRLALRGFFIVILLVVGGYYALKAHKEQYETKAQNAYFEGEKSYQDSLAALAPKEEPKKDAKKPAAQKPTEIDPKKADTAQAESKLQSVIKDFPESNASFQAALLLSVIYENKDQANKAIEVLEGKSNQKSSSGILNAVIDLKLSSLYEKNKNCDKAIEVLNNVISDKKTAEFKPESILRQALCNETLGHNDKAKELYEKLSSEFPDTQQGQQASKYLQLISQNGKSTL